MLLGLIQLTLFLIVGILLTCTYYALRHALQQRQMEEQTRQQLLTYVMAGLLIWLLLLAVLAYGGYFQNFEKIPPRLLLALLPPMLLALILTFSKSFATLLRLIPSSWLVYIQSFRIAMELLLWLGLVAGIVPFQMTFQGFNYDIILGLSAIGAGFLFFGKGRQLRFEAFLWNISGIALLVNILFISIISTPSPFRVFMNEPANTMVAYFPFIWIPGFIVPFALAMHLFSIRQLQLKQSKRRTFRLRRKKVDEQELKDY
ncbi:MAG: hypothetical protein AAFV25_04515 [Bacteroidota bacterium]